MSAQSWGDHTHVSNQYAHTGLAARSQPAVNFLKTGIHGSQHFL